MFPFDEVLFREALNTADVVWGDEVYDQDAPNQLSVITLLFAVLALTCLSLPSRSAARRSEPRTLQRWPYTAVAV